jgi:hypothetical protein
LEKVWKRHLGHLVVGLKFTHRREPAFSYVLDDPEVKKIVLRRDNRVKTWVSRRRAELTGQWEVYETNDLRPGPRIETDPDDLFQSVAADEEHYRYIGERLAANGQRAFAATYERLEEQSQDVLAFLGVSAHPLEVRSVKQSADDLRLLVSDYDRLRAALSGTELGADLDP